MTKEQKNEYYREYYKKHKQEILERNKKWRENNKKKYYLSVYKCRKRKAKELKEQGIKYNWFSNAKREKINEQKGINR